MSVCRDLCHDVLCGPGVRNYCESESIGVDGHVTVRLFTTEIECINKSSSCYELTLSTKVDKLTVQL